MREKLDSILYVVLPYCLWGFKYKIVGGSAPARTICTIRKRKYAPSVYTFWHIWKERGRRIFQKESKPASVVASLIRSDLDLLELARVRDGV
jgi:hypothetical protein